jgi:pyruvate/2-oxoglutarate dehydrogenase complex dihydrolipoamide acyltransferase (E2) component
VGQATGQVEQLAQGTQETAEQANTQQAQDTPESAVQQTQDTAEQTAQQTGGAQEATGQQPGATSAANQKAEELGVDLTEVKGTGSGGLITLEDVTSAAKQG